MHARLIAIVAAALLALTAAGASVAAGPSTIVLTSITTVIRETDKPPKGPSRGDTFYAESRLLNGVAQFGKKKGAVVGFDKGTSTLTGPRSARMTGKVTLPGGTLSIRGRITEQQDGTVTVPVTGGTGVFAGARGTVTIGGTAKRAVNVYRLTYPLAA